MPAFQGALHYFEEGGLQSVLSWIAGLMRSASASGAAMYPAIRPVASMEAGIAWTGQRQPLGASAYHLATVTQAGGQRRTWPD